MPATAEVSRADLRYFKSVSDFMFEELARARGREQRLKPVGTWGLIAAVLGNSSNRAAFQRKIWSAEAAPLTEARRLAMQSVAADKKALVTATGALNNLTARLDALDRALLPPRREIEKLQQSIASVRAALGDRVADESFFAREHRELHLASAWMPDALQRKREDLFVAAMAVHKAFIDVAAAKVLHTSGSS